MKKVIISFLGLFLILSAQETGARYLIITHNNFYNHILPLARWKHKKGMRTKVVTLSETGSTASQIRNYIVNAYNNWLIKPEYILFVGAPNLIPFPSVLGWNSDNYYTNMDGDLYNEILSGRLTVHDTIETKTVVNKILAYERTPNTTDSLWFKRACLIANEDYGIYPPQGNDTVYWNDVRYAKNLMLANGYNLIDTLSCGLGNNASNVYNSINNGRGFLMYRGSGFGNWYLPFECYPQYYTNNGTRLPIVLSFTCCTIGTGSTPAGAEMWFLCGTPTNLKGGAGYFATTTVGGGFITFLRSAVSRGFFDAIFVDGKRTFGEACEGGRIRVYSMYPYSGGDEEYVGFTTIGDPEMNIWTATPCSLSVTHPQVIPCGSANFTVNVRRAISATPISGALVCITAKQDTNIYCLDTTDANGDAYFSINPLFVNDTIYVTVTGRNLKPYEGSMQVLYSGMPYVVYLKSFIDDSPSGNNNHLINPGETINLPLWVRNWGDSIARSVIGILRSNDQYITVFDSTKSFGDISGHDSAFTGNNGYGFSVNSNCPDFHSVVFDLMCRDVNDSMWISHFNYSVYAPVLTLQEVQISGGNGNSNLEPGETVFVKVKIKNSGHSPIDNVNATLQTLSSYAIVIDSFGSYAHIGPDSNAINESNPFSVFALPSTPQGTNAEFRIVLNAPFYQDTITFSIIIGKKDYYIWNPDHTPEPGQNMDTILSNLGYSGDIGTTLPVDLSYYNVVFVCLGVWPNNHIISQTSPEATRLVNFANSGGRLYMEGGDVWSYDPTQGGYNFSSLFGLHPDNDGGSNMGPVGGISGTFTNGMLFNYGGENNYMDHISPLNPNSFLIFRDTDNNFNCGVAYDAGTYRTVATSFELGLLVDGTPPSTRSALLDSIMHFFGCYHSIAEDLFSRCQVSEPFLKIYPNPFRNHLIIQYAVGSYKCPAVSIKIYDASGRLVKNLSFHPSSFIPHSSSLITHNSIEWDRTDDSGRRLPSGVYFVWFETDDFKRVEKVILIK
uniref:T9SS type A sorting domain-containing protein n=1 Tax=candidate division WOR-3 bacterium TaxID=2052148 RepID=A0A7C4XFJ8_UNCW3